MKKLLIAASIAVAAMSANVHAANWYLGLSAGEAKVSFDALDVPPISTSEDTKASSYKVFGGYNFNTNFALEGGYQNTESFSQTATFASSTAKVELDGSGFFIDAVGKIPTAENFTLYGKFGFSRTKLKAKGFLDGVFAAELTEYETNPRFGLGAQYEMTKEFGVRLDAERTFNVGDSDTTGESDVDYLGLGLVLKF